MPLVTVVIPIEIDPVLDPKKVEKAVEAALNASGKRMVEKFNRTTASWTGAKPVMATETDMKEGSVWAGPQGDMGSEGTRKWVWLDGGTEPHPIAAHGLSSRSRLVFPFQGPGRSYIAATIPRTFHSGPHRKIGPIITPRAVNHPGIREPRDWSGYMAAIENVLLADAVQAALDAAMEG